MTLIHFHEDDNHSKQYSHKHSRFFLDAHHPFLFYYVHDNLYKKILYSQLDLYDSLNNSSIFLCVCLSKLGNMDYRDQKLPESRHFDYDTVNNLSEIGWFDEEDLLYSHNHFDGSHNILLE